LFVSLGSRVYFEGAIAADQLPTVTALAERGKHT